MRRVGQAADWLRMFKGNGRTQKRDKLNNAEYAATGGRGCSLPLADQLMPMHGPDDRFPSGIILQES